MTSVLRPEILTPTPPYVRRLLLGSVVASVGVVVMAGGYQARDAEPIASLELREPALEPLTQIESIAREPAPPSRTGELAMVFQVAGISYLKLADLSGDGATERTPRHGAPELAVGDDGVVAAIAAVEADRVALTHRAWRGKAFVVDGTCRATVGELAVIARLVGTPDYAGGEGETWTAAAVMTSGERVLAARLDGCTSGHYARDASLSPVVVIETVDDAGLARAGTRLMLASSETAAAQVEWLATPQASGGERGHWTDAEGAVIEAHVVRHPETGVRWVSVQGRYDGGCGLPTLNVWKLYRVHADGTLAPVPTLLDEHATVVERLIDVEGDGELEVVTTAWLGLGRNVNRAGGMPLARDRWQFFGCPC